MVCTYMYLRLNSNIFHVMFTLTCMLQVSIILDPVKILVRDICTCTCTCTSFRATVILDGNGRNGKVFLFWINFFRPVSRFMDVIQHVNLF